MKSGEIVPLTVQLDDGNDSCRVVARVLDPMQELVFEGDLLHVHEGLYQNRQFVMPAKAYVTVTYQVFGVTKEGGDYGRGSELFYLDESLAEIRQLLEEYSPTHKDFYTGQVVEENRDDFIEGAVSV